MNGAVTDAFGLKKGMTVNATKIVETPVTSVSQHQQVSGTCRLRACVDRQGIPHS